MEKDRTYLKCQNVGCDRVANCVATFDEKHDLYSDQGWVIGHSITRVSVHLCPFCKQMDQPLRVRR